MSISLVTGDLPVQRLLQMGYAAWARGDMQPLFSMVAPSCELTIIGSPALNAGSGTWIGPAGIAQAFRTIRGQLHLRDMTIESMVVTETTAFIHRLTTHEVVTTGRLHESEFVDVMTLRGQEIMRCQIFYDSASMALATGQARVVSVTGLEARGPGGIPGAGA